MSTTHQSGNRPYDKLFGVMWWGEEVFFELDGSTKTWRVVGDSIDTRIKDGYLVVVQSGPNSRGLAMVHEPRQHYDPDEERYAFRQLIFARPDGQVQVIFKGRFDPIRFFWSEGERHLAALVEEKYEEDFEIKSRWLFVSSSDTAELEVSEERADKIVEVALSPEGEIVAYREDNGKRSVLRDTLHRQLLAGDNISGLRYGRTGDRQFIRYNVGSGRRAYSTLVFMKNQ